MPKSIPITVPTFSVSCFLSSNVLLPTISFSALGIVSSRGTRHNKNRPIFRLVKKVSGKSKVIQLIYLLLRTHVYGMKYGVHFLTDIKSMHFARHESIALHYHFEQHLDLDYCTTAPV